MTEVKLLRNAPISDYFKRGGENYAEDGRDTLDLFQPDCAC
jgi:hypothetical protein